MAVLTAPLARRGVFSDSVFSVQPEVLKFFRPRGLLTLQILNTVNWKLHSAARSVQCFVGGINTKGPLPWDFVLRPRGRVGPPGRP